MKEFNAIEIMANLKRDPRNFTTIGWDFTNSPDGNTPVPWCVRITGWCGALPLTMDEFMNKPEKDLEKCTVTIYGGEPPQQVVLVDSAPLVVMGGMGQFMQFFKQDVEIYFQ